jgi:hypothetical protein
VKLDYTIKPERRDNRYRIETYFFIPVSLGVDPYTYSRELFYRDIQAYIRFKTPVVALAALLEPDNARSPFNALAPALARALRSDHDVEAHRTISHELRLLGCLVRATTRDRAVDAIRRLQSARGQVQAQPALVDDARLGAGSLVADIDAVMTRFRGLRASFAEPVLPAWLKQVYQCVDEYLSLSIENTFTMLVEEIDLDPGARSALAAERERLAAVLLAERRHREGARYQSVLRPDAAQEQYIYRSGLLKKFVSSVLFLRISKETEGRRLTDLIAAFAAGVAMLLATLAAIFSQRRWGWASLPFVGGVVVSYILKDRVKDWLKIYFSMKMTRWLADYNVRIRDPESGVVLGRCREAFSFLPETRVPAGILERRHRDAMSPVEAEGKPEVVMKYEKDVHLDGRIIGDRYGRMSDINDIIRFNISHFLARTDDPIRVVRYYDPAGDAVESVRCPKVYHVNVVFAFRGADRTTLERVRVVLDKRGIRRLEEA